MSRTVGHLLVGNLSVVQGAEYSILGTVDTGITLICERWLLSKDGRANIIQKYPKRMAINLKRVPGGEHNRSYFYEEIESFISISESPTHL